MYFRRFFAALVAVVLFAATVDIAQAYPVLARTGTTTVTGAYRPLELNLNLVNGTGELEYYYGEGTFFSYRARFSGEFKSSGYDENVTGLAGNWDIEFNTSSFFADATNVDNTIILSSSYPGDVVGTLTFQGGGNYGDFGDQLSFEDTPQFGDVFMLTPKIVGAFLQVICLNGIDVCSNFELSLVDGQELLHLGPFFDSCGGDCNAPSYSLDARRVNEDCLVRDLDGKVFASKFCGRGLLVSNGVPEPASLALVGLGLVALALGRRRQRQRLR